MIFALTQSRRKKAMTVKTLLTITMIVTAVFVFKAPVETIIDILILEFILTLFWLTKEEK